MYDRRTRAHRACRRHHRPAISATPEIVRPSAPATAGPPPHTTAPLSLRPLPGRSPRPILTEPPTRSPNPFRRPSRDISPCGPTGYGSRDVTVLDPHPSCLRSGVVLLL